LQINLDFERQDRQGFSETIYGEGKSLEQLIEITKQHLQQQAPMLITRIDPQHANQLIESNPQTNIKHYLDGHCLIYYPKSYQQHKKKGSVALVSAGSSDMNVVEETSHTLSFYGVEHFKLSDCGVAGIHRLLDKKDQLLKADLCIVVAGMDGALPSVVGGLVPFPVIAVPTSVGYGASFGGLSALLSMINSCASGVSVVNIDNGFGAAMSAIRTLRLINSDK
jgi:NCAIR mutase (PurE)-related protein